MLIPRRKWLEVNRKKIQFLKLNEQKKKIHSNNNKPCDIECAMRSSTIWALASRIDGKNENEIERNDRAIFCTHNTQEIEERVRKN